MMGGRIAPSHATHNNQGVGRERVKSISEHKNNTYFEKKTGRHTDIFLGIALHIKLDNIYSFKYKYMIKFRTNVLVMKNLRFE